MPTALFVGPVPPGVCPIDLLTLPAREPCSSITAVKLTLVPTFKSAIAVSGARSSNLKNNYF